MINHCTRLGCLHSGENFYLLHRYCGGGGVLKCSCDYHRGVCTEMIEVVVGSDFSKCAPWFTKQDSEFYSCKSHLTNLAGLNPQYNTHMNFLLFPRSMPGCQSCSCASSAWSTWSPVLFWIVTSASVPGAGHPAQRFTGASSKIFIHCVHNRQMVPYTFVSWK